MNHESHRIKKVLTELSDKSSYYLEPQTTSFYPERCQHCGILCSSSLGPAEAIRILNEGPVLVYSPHCLELRLTSFELTIICPEK